MFNRRNAMVGWAAWEVGKRVLRAKARSAVPVPTGRSRRPNLSAILLVAAAAAGALAFWRKRDADSEQDAFE
jgi:ferric-dicitrate binding protein FerR (iron transport regulator)